MASFEYIFASQTSNGSLDVSFLLENLLKNSVGGALEGSSLVQSF